MSNRWRDPARRSLPLAEWPAADRALWQAAVRKGDLLEDDGLAAHWRPKTQAHVVQNYGRWLTFLARRGELDATASPPERVTPERLRAYRAEMREQGVAATTLYIRIADLGQALRVMGPGPVPQRLREIVRRLAIQAKPRRDKAARVQSARTLFELGLALMQRALDEPDRLYQPARFRDGLIIALLAARPVRLSNLIGIRIGRNLVRVEAAYWLRFAADEMKGKLSNDFGN